MASVIMFMGMGVSEPVCLSFFFFSFSNADCSMQFMQPKDGVNVKKFVKSEGETEINFKFI